MLIKSNRITKMYELQFSAFLKYYKNICFIEISKFNLSVVSFGNNSFIRFIIYELN